MKITLHISPCPNDTFMFDALLNGRIDTRGFRFETRYADIEQLNAMLLQDNPRATMSKISYAALPQALGRYRLSDTGSALGYGTGPVLVAARPVARERFAAMRVAIPGEQTTANRLMSMLFPEVTQKQACLFSGIADAVLEGRADAGVLIHEGRFTYRDRGLRLLSDLGGEWEAQTGMPLPLGAIVISRDLPGEVQRTLEELLRQSILYALRNPSDSAAFVRSHAQEMDPEVIGDHIRTFVNEYSVSLDQRARQGISRLLGMEEKELFA